MDPAQLELIRKAIQLAQEANTLKAEAAQRGEAWGDREATLKRAEALLDEATQLYAQMK